MFLIDFNFSCADCLQKDIMVGFVKQKWQKPVTLEELLVSTLPQGRPSRSSLIEKGVITQREFLQKIAEERATYQKLLKPTVQ